MLPSSGFFLHADNGRSPKKGDYVSEVNSVYITQARVGIFGMRLDFTEGGVLLNKDRPT